MGNNLTNQYVSASFQQLVQISGSGQLTDGTGSAIDNITITASYASQAGTSGYSATAGTSGYASTAGFASQAGTSGFATTASYAENAIIPNLQQVTDVGIATTNEVVIQNTLHLDKGNVNIDIANSGSTNTSTNAITGVVIGQSNTISNTNDVTIGQSNNIAELFNGANNLVLGRDNTITGNFTSYNYILGYSNAVSGDNSGRVILGYDHTSTAGNFSAILGGTLNSTAHDRSVVIGGTGLSTLKNDEVVVPNLRVISDITGSNATFESASIGHLTTVTGSAVIIGDAYVIVNSSATTRYAGIKVYESGSVVPTTASLEYDSQTNDWFYEYTGSDPTNFGAVMFGPEYATKGSPTYPTANTLVKGNGGHHLIDSSITDDGTDVVVSANISASGFVSASTYYGDGSNLTGLVTSPFPYTGSAEISGSLTITDAATSTNLVSNGNATIAVGGATTISGTNNAIIGGESNSIVGSSRNTIVGGLTNSITSNDDGNGIFAGRSNTISVASGDYNAIVAGQGNTISGTGGEYGFIGGGTNHTLSGGDSTAIVGGNTHLISSTGVNNAIVGGASHEITGTGNHNVIIGGFNSAISSNQVYIFGGEQNSITGGSQSTILGGGGGSITGGNRNIIIGGLYNTASHNQSVVIGGQYLSTSKDDEAVVNHLSIYGDTYISSSTLGTGSLIDNLGQEGVATTTSINHVVYCTQAEYDGLTPDANTMYVISGSGEVVQDLIVSGSMIGEVNAISVASSTGSLDCSIGNYFTLGLANAADTRLEASNIQIGQTINIKITNNATAAGTISFGPEFEFEGGSAFTATAATNAVDIITLVSFDGTSLQTVGVKNFS